MKIGMDVMDRMDGMGGNYGMEVLMDWMAGTEAEASIATLTW